MLSAVPSVGQTIAGGWNAFRVNAGPLIGGYLLFAVVAVTGSALPFLNVVFLAVGLFPLVGGLYILTNRAASGARTRAFDVFSGFTQMGRWLGAGWLWVGVFGLATVPYWIGLIPVLLVVEPLALERPQYVAVANMIMIPAVALTGLLLLLLSTRWFFSWFFVADGSAPIEAFRRSARATLGIRWRVLGTLFVLWIFSFTGIAALGVGWVVTSLVALQSAAFLYRRLAQRCDDGAGQ